MTGDRAAWFTMSDPSRPLHDRVKAVFHYNRFDPDPYFPHRFPSPFDPQGFEPFRNGNFSVSDPAGKVARQRSFCTRLFDLVTESPSYIAALDRQFSELLECGFYLPRNSDPFLGEPCVDLTVEVLKPTLQLLERLPRTPVELPGLPGGLPPVYFSRCRMRTAPDALVWDDLQAASYLSTNVIRVALYIVINPRDSGGRIMDLANVIAELIEAAVQSSSSSSRTSAVRYRWFVVKSFLWASWHRTVMLFFSLLLGQQLEVGVDDSVSETLDLLQSFSPMPGVSIQEMSKRYTAVGKSHYMCTWAFQLLRNAPVCINMDFRKFRGLYSRRFDRFAARCTPNRKFSCKGDHPHYCQRFVGMVISNQSAHDRGCKGCQNIT